MVTLVRHDLDFILAQIKLSEQHATKEDANGNPVAGTALADLLNDPHLPFGLRTVDGTYNNIVPGRELYGSADQPMVRLLDPVFQTADDNPFIPGTQITSYAQTSGSVFDADPRLISNLIVDQTINNPAALLSALERAGLPNATAAAADIKAAYDLTIATAGTPDEAAAITAFEALTDAYGIDFDGDIVLIPNISPDEGMTAPFNSWMTLFGQFFDHGLDLVSKGGSGTVFIPLSPDDPLYIPGSQANFMVLTRATNQPGADGILGTADDVREHKNTTTPWIDQNQTYTSHASHQVFLREYVLDADGKPVATGHLLEGATGGLATWADIKEQARTMLGINLTDADVTNVPLLATDEYGRFLRGPDGFAQLVVNTGSGPILVEGNPAAPISTVGAVRTGHAFLDDIAHNAAPVIVGGQLIADADDVAGNPVAANAQGQNLEYDNELLDAHFIGGDGRANENIGLTAVHMVFHSEHNRLVEHTKSVVLEAGDLAFLNEWLDSDVLALPTTQAEIDALVWDGERLFQAARFTTEMQYQHLVFEEFARKVQPAIDLFVFNNTTDINPAIVAEFAHVVYRFGHSMLTEEVARIDANGVSNDIGLIEAFLNPIAFNESGATAEEAAGAIIRGMSRQVGNEIDEFVTGAVRNNLVGLPLDLAAINIARGRDTGMPSLNAARAEFYEQSGSAWLKPYTSWVDFAQNIKNPASVINFIAAYGTHSSITSAATAADKRDAATLLVLGGTGAPADRVAFLTSTGAWATAESGLNLVDFWIGGLAEELMPFGGMLGSTFMYVFEAQMENLQNSDRFYYLTRTQGLNLLNELEANSFASLVKLNTDLGNGGPHLNGELFGNADYIIEMNTAWQLIADPTHDNPILAALFPKVDRRDTDNDGDADYLRFDGAEHVVLGGTSEDDTLIADEGDDTLWGDDGNDYLDGGAGVNRLHGGAGNDIIFDGGDISFIHGEDGDDVISAGRGVGELIFAGAGNDFVIVGDDGKEAFGGTGDDFILGGSGMDFLLGNEGDDWIEGGDGFDTIAGDNSELFFNSTIIGHDVMFSGPNEQDFDGESGDDIMVQGESVIRNEGMFGYDWVTHKGSRLAANIDLERPIFTTDELDILRNRYDQVEGASGWNYNDVILGDDRTGGDLDVGDTPGQNETTLFAHELTQAGIDRIAGLRDVVGIAATGNPDDIAYTGGNILLGGGGSDIIEGRGGDDIIDGDAWLNVRISVRSQADPNVELFTVDSLTEIQSRMLTREILPSQLKIVREILYNDAPANNDIAVFNDVVDNYDFDVAPDGALIVAHTRFAVNQAIGLLVSDGTDRLRNIETLRFSDGLGGFIDLPISAFINTPASGAPTISDQTPTEGQVLIADPSTIVDPNGLPDTFEYQWQQSADGGLTWTNIATGFNQTFTPTQAQVGLLLRVEVSFFDINGNFETVVSAATGGVGDLINGNGQDNIIDGTEFDDVINGNGGNDTLRGLGGNDRLDGGAGADVLVGGGGVNVLTGGAGDDMLFGGEGGDLLNGDGGADRLTGGAGGDTLNGGAGNDLLFGMTGDDILNGDAGADQLDGGEGADIMTGGAGNDTYVVDSLGDVVIEGAGDNGDTIITTLNNYTLQDNIENLIFGGTGNFVGVGNAANNTISGGSADNVLTGLAGADTLNGFQGNDRFIETAGSGNDTYNGGAGSDTLDLSLTTAATTVNLVNGTATGTQIGNNTLTSIENVIGGSGVDTITASTAVNTFTGGAGADVFVFTSAANAGIGETLDTITDFVRGQDRINVSGIDASTSGGLLDLLDNDAFTSVAQGTTFTGAGQIRYEQTTIGGTAYTIVRGNTDAGGPAEFEIALLGTYNLTTADFIL